MKRLRTIIVDDEAPARERLKRFLSHNDMVELIGEAGDGKSAVEMIEDENPDLIFLDIQMPELDGFGVIKMLIKPPIIIFVTAYDQYAIKAFEVNALDYLLKPFTRERLERAVEKAQQEFFLKADFTSKIDALFQTLNKQKRYLERIAVRHEGRILVIPINEIDWIGAEEGAIYLHSKDKSYLANYTLDELDSRLSPRLFFRAHRSAIINLNRVKEIIPWFAGSYRVRLSSGVEIDISRNRIKELKKIVNW
jgi:two-component system LytT family response regulator